MAITIGSNIASLQAQRQLFSASQQTSTVFERLSSGQRINRASDDAAGLAIADSLSKDSRVFTQGVRNFSDGISLLNIADGALDQLSGITTRLIELTEQAANGVLGRQQRVSLNEEAQALKDEYLRIVQSTEFNDRKLFDGSLGELRLQGGFGVDGSIASGLGGAIGTGTFTLDASFSVTTDPREVALGDINGDGITDFVTGGEGSSSLGVFLGTGDGSFSRQSDISLSSYAYEVALEDLNGDGVLDLVTGMLSSGGPSIAFGAGDGTFGEFQSYFTNQAPRDFAFGDFDGDGSTDIAAVAPLSNFENIAIYRNNGDGTFEATHTAELGSFLIEVEAADFNNDGVDDLVSIAFSDDEFNILLGAGDGTFQGPSTISTGAGPTKVAIADYTGDGNLDLAVGNFTDGTVSIFSGNGDGTFQAQGSFSTVAQVRDLETGDLNGDGITDLFVVGESGNAVESFLGAGDGTFTSSQSLFVGTGSFSAGLGDFDGDGVLDAVVMNFGDSNVAILSGDANEGVAPLLDFSLETISDARQALPIFQRKLNQLAEQRGQIGAFQSRVNTASRVLEVSAENSATAESRIRDADIAFESSQLTRLTILQQAASAVLSQANLQPSLALNLLS